MMRLEYSDPMNHLEGKCSRQDEEGVFDMEGIE